MEKSGFEAFVARSRGQGQRLKVKGSRSRVLLGPEGGSGSRRLSFCLDLHFRTFSTFVNTVLSSVARVRVCACAPRVVLCLWRHRWSCPVTRGLVKVGIELRREKRQRSGRGGSIQRPQPPASARLRRSPARKTRRRTVGAERRAGAGQPTSPSCPPSLVVNWRGGRATDDPRLRLTNDGKTRLIYGRTPLKQPQRPGEESSPPWQPVNVTFSERKLLQRTTTVEWRGKTRAVKADDDGELPRERGAGLQADVRGGRAAAAARPGRSAPQL